MTFGYFVSNYFSTALTAHPPSPFFSKGRKMNPVKDLDGDGKLSAEEIEQSKIISDIEHEDEKFDTQKKLVWATFFSMIGFVAVLCSPWLSDARVSSLTSVASTFAISMAGIIAAYMGAQAFMAKPKK